MARLTSGMRIWCGMGCFPRITAPLCNGYIVVSGLVLLLTGNALLCDNSAPVNPLWLLRIAMASWEMAVCDGPLSALLSQLTLRPDPAAEYWDGPGAVPRRSPCVLQDIENARLASLLWRDIIDSSSEWALIRLSRWDHSNEVGALWETYDEYIMNRFFQSWDLFSTLSEMANPVACPRLRKDPLMPSPALGMSVIMVQSDS
ncbi:hypothetical protein KC19_VG309800 [Ceratodon purpureus]|uniref:Uncharacterized protein n=1 Tax=Ceratodon purpureus TaxID=3225 RepID=A0A8T0HVC2_CERPU|nr:hypothetical protein KC19_VG309800 [Ceratodon purpureus]